MFDKFHNTCTEILLMKKLHDLFYWFQGSISTKLSYFITYFLPQDKTIPCLFCCSCLYVLNSVYLLTTTIMSTIRCFSFTTLYKTKSLINLHKKQNKYLISKVGESTSVGESTKHPEKKRKIHHYVCNITNGDFPTQVEPISVKEVPCPSYHCVDGGNPHCQKRNKSSS